MPTSPSLAKVPIFCQAFVLTYSRGGSIRCVARRYGGSHEVPLPGQVALITAVGLTRRVEVGDLADRHVPPSLAVRRVDQWVGGHVYEDRPCIVRPRLGRPDRLVELGAGADFDDVHTEAAGIGGKVYREHVALQPAIGITITIARAETLGSQLLRERADRVEAVVLHEDHDDLDPLLNGGDQLGRHHEIATVPDHREDVPGRVREAYPDGGGNLVAHA